MNIDHGIGIVIGVALAAILVVPLCILVVWLVRGYRASLEAEKAQAAKLAELIGELKTELENLRGGKRQMGEIECRRGISQIALEAAVRRSPSKA